MLERLRDVAFTLRVDAETWCEERSPWLRGLLHAYLFYAGVRHAANPLYASWFSGLTLGLHELGHVLAAPLGMTAHLLAGSVFQIVMPLLAAVYLLIRQRDPFGFVVGLAWLSFAGHEMATYMADASREQLALVGFSDDPIHDWSALFTRWHVLNHCRVIGGGVRLIAFSIWLAAMAFGGWLLWRMLRASLRRASGG